MLLADLAATSDAVAATSARSRKTALLAGQLKAAGPAEVPIVVSYLSGELRQRRTGVGWASLRELPAAATEPSLTVTEVDDAFAGIAGLAGVGSQSERRRRVTELLARATEPEQRFLGGLVSGELRQGALAALLIDAVAQAAGVPTDDVRRAVMLRGEAGPVATALLTDGVDGLARFRLEVGRAVQPMLAQPVASMTEALTKLGPAAVEWKFDGVRVQVHKRDDDVHVFTRTLDEITVRVPEIVEMASALPVRSVVLDGEAIALRADGRPHPFQVTGSRIGSRVDISAARAKWPLTPYLFDLLHLDGDDLLARSGADRFDVLETIVPADLLVPRLVTSDVTAAQAFFDDAVARGHEGVVVKSLEASYAAGRRGVGWVKVKPVHTLDLVVLAVEWGHGRRRGWLSNLHLGARDPDTGGFVMLGKTFKGLTDEMLAWQTEQFLELAVEQSDWQVVVRPELVVEVAFDGVQTSPRYPGGMALRFARVIRYRPDKRADEADTVDTVRALHQRT